MRSTLITLTAALAVVACTPDTPSPTEREPEPQTRHTELRDAIQQPQDRARAVEDDLRKAAERQQRELDAAGG